jgi:hypothetical protein
VVAAGAEVLVADHVRRGDPAGAVRALREAAGGARLAPGAPATGAGGGRDTGTGRAAIFGLERGGRW